MDSFIQELLAADQLLASQKMVATGMETPRLPRGMLAASLASEGEFNDLVSSVYRWYWDDLSEDRGFLGRQTVDVQSGKVRAFDKTLSMLRHSAQHGGDRYAEARSEWTSFHGGEGVAAEDKWNACAMELLRSLAAALTVLSEVAHVIVLRQESRLEWTNLAAETPERLIAIVFQDLGLSLGGGQFKFQVAQYRSSPRRRQARDSSERLRYAAAQVCGANLRQLPVSYQEILQALELIGQANARSALLVAHAVAEVQGLRDQELVDATAKVWKLVANN